MTGLNLDLGRSALVGELQVLRAPTRASLGAVADTKADRIAAGDHHRRGRCASCVFDDVPRTIAFQDGTSKVRVPEGPPSSPNAPRLFKGRRARTYVDRELMPSE